MLLSWLKSRLPARRLLQNISANMVGGAWTGLLIIWATPKFVSLLSFEGYGVVGLWLAMQVVMTVFDLGLGATLVKEFADSRESPELDIRRRDLLRTLELIYWPVAMSLTIAIAFAANWIAGDWLHLHVFSAGDIGSAIRWMAVALGLQYPGSLYLNGLAGLQRQGRMNALQMAGNGLRYGGGVAVLLWHADPVWFFRVQALVAGAQTVASRGVLWHMISGPGRPSAKFRVSVLKSVWRFSAGMAATMISSVLLTNADRLYISKYMPTAELGKYALAFTATGLLQMGIQPFYRAYFPRFSELVAKDDSERLRREYYHGCRLTAGIIVPSALMGWAFSSAIFRTWMGAVDPTSVEVFRWLLLGIAGAGLMWLPAAFQQANGWTRLHAGMIAGALVVGAPLLFWTTHWWGTAGATVIWVIHGTSDATLGLWLMHRRLLKKELLVWYLNVLVPALLWSGPIVALSWWLMPVGLGRGSSAAWLGVTGLLAVGVTLAYTAHRHPVQTRVEA